MTNSFGTSGRICFVIVVVPSHFHFYLYGYFAHTDIFMQYKRLFKNYELNNTNHQIMYTLEYLFLIYMLWWNGKLGDGLLYKIQTKLPMKGNNHEAQHPEVPEDEEMRTKQDKTARPLCLV